MWIEVRPASSSSWTRSQLDERHPCARRPTSSRHMPRALLASACWQRSQRLGPECRNARRAAPLRRTATSRGDVRIAVQPSRRRRRPAARLCRRTDELPGSNAPYQKPGDADLRLETADTDPADNARRIVDALERRQGCENVAVPDEEPDGRSFEDVARAL